MATLINAKLRIEQPKTLGLLNDEELKSAHLVKDELIPPSVLALPNSAGHITQEADACDVPAGCMWVQTQQDNTRKPIEYC